MVDNQGSLPETVTVLKASNGSVVYLVGITHYSKKIQEDIAQVINAVRPDGVVIELCQNRNNILLMDDHIISNNAGITFDGLKKSCKELGVIHGIFYQLMMNLSVSIPPNLDVVPGGEFRVAVDEAEKYNSYIYFGDRPVDITIKRLISMLSCIEIIKLFEYILYSRGFKTIQKDMDILEMLTFEFAKHYPELEKVFVDERDKYLTYNLQSCAGIELDETGFKHNLNIPKPQVIVGVVGLYHIAGIKNYWETITKEQVSELTIITPQSRSTKLVQIAIMISAVGFFLWGIFNISEVQSLINILRNYGNRIQGRWIFGLCWEHVGILEKRYFIVNKRDRATLLPIIQAEIEIGSTIHIDEESINMFNKVTMVMYTRQ